MQSYTNASNARRAAKALAAKYDTLVVAKDMVRDDHVEAYYATVHVTMGVAPEEVRKNAKMVPMPKTDKPVSGETLVGRVSVEDAFKGKLFNVTEPTVFTPKANEPKAEEPKVEGNVRADGTPMTPEEVGTVARVVEAPAPATKVTKGQQALDLIGRKDGATAAEMMEALGWQAHTLRGWVSIQNSKHKRGIVGTKVNKVTTFTIGKPKK